MEKKKRRIKVPHTYVILLICVFVVAVATWFVPTGQYDRVVIDDREVVDVDSYHETEPTPIGLFAFFRAIPEGMENSAQIIFFILIVAGMFNVVMATGSIQKGIGRLALVSEGKEKIVIPLVMFAFSLGGSTFGMAEELVAFVPIGIMLARAVGYDAIVGAGMVILGGACGFDAGIMNPFTVGVAQGLADLPTFSGMGLRIVILIVINLG